MDLVGRCKFPFFFDVGLIENSIMDFFRRGYHAWDVCLFA